MRTLSFISAFVLVFSSLPEALVSATSIARHSDLGLRGFYTRAHSLGDDYKFDSREWHSVNATDLSYKYEDSTLGKRNSKASGNASSKLGLSGTVSHLVGDVWNGLKGLGKSQDVKITWYSGHDLKNPSCWSNSGWAPTDNSFACALTLQGWTSQPKCFKFIELCSGTKKCIFVRVVDSCAGCAPGSKHVDLTKSAFSQLADIDQGVLNVQMRLATDPDAWYEDLWGPKQ